MEPLVALRIDGPSVVILSMPEGKPLLCLDWSAADVLSTALRAAARQAEANAKASSIVLDQAFLVRAGSPFGLTLDPKVISEAKKEAAHNSEIRKMLPHTPDERRDDLGIPSVVKG